MKKLLVVLLVVMLTATVVLGGKPALGEDSNISVSVKTDKLYYKVGEPIKITFIIRNNGNSPVRFTFNTAQMYDFSIINYGWGKPVYRWSKGKMFAQVITHLEIPANGEKVFEFVWDQKPNMGTSVTVGGYMVNFWLTVQGKTVPKPGSNSPYFASTKFEVSSTVGMPFPDVVNPYQQGFVKKLYEAGLIKGFPDGTFKPNNHLTRAEAITLILRLKHIVPSGSYKQDFTDVTVNFWAFKFIEEAYNRGIVKGTGNEEFSPNKPITRGEFTVMLIKALKFEYIVKADPFVDISPAYSGYKEIITAYYRGIVFGIDRSGKKYFYPESPITRGDAAVEMGRALYQDQSNTFSILEGIKEKPFAKEENPINIVPNVPDYTVELNSIENANAFSFNDAQKEFFEQNGFFIKKSDYDTFEKFYESNTGKPLFVSFDTFLQAYHTIFDLALRYDEVSYFKNDLDELNKTLIFDCVSKVAENSPKSLLPAVVRDIEYLYVGEKLLNPDYKLPDFLVRGLNALFPEENPASTIENNVKAETGLINAHNGFAVSPVFGYEEDYSQYVPRGHYTKTEDLKRYFKAMMWFGRMRFLLRPGETLEMIEIGRSQTRSAIILSLVLGSSEDLEMLYNKIYEPTVFFVGKSDDLNFYNYLPLIKKVFGEKVSVSALSDTKKIDEFIDEALKLPNLKISTIGEMNVNFTKGLRFMGQRFTPDAYILQNLVYPKAGYRMMPKAMDVFFVLENKTASNILLNTYGESKNEAYVLQVQKLQEEFSKLTLRDWLQNLYWGWLSILKQYAIGKRTSGYPFFMRNENWANKELVTVLSSYTELKHDTILYAKQSYTTKSAMPVLKPGYVEPNVQGFNRLLTLLDMTEQGLSERNLLPKVLKDKIKFLKSLTKQALEISKKELQNEEPSKEDKMYFAAFPDAMNELLGFSDDFVKALGGSNEKVPLVADIHTDPNGDNVLEEGVGYVNTIFVVAPFNGKMYIFKGPVFSYFEFTEKFSNRLTDERWNSMLKVGNVPETPVWELSLIP